MFSCIIPFLISSVILLLLLFPSFYSESFKNRQVFDININVEVFHFILVRGGMSSWRLVELST